jgi:hypothetical protein
MKLELQFERGCFGRKQEMADDVECKESSIERREYFRVKDVLPMIAQKIDGMAGKKSRILSGYFSGLGISHFAEDPPDGTISPKLWRVLGDINSKLDLILDKLFGKTEETANAQVKEVSLSASGLNFITQNEHALGDLMEVKIFLPLHPPVWVVVYGNVTRISDMNDDQEREVAIHFNEIEDEVRDILSFYTIKRQREIIMKQRRQDIE